MNKMSKYSNTLFQIAKQNDLLEVVTEQLYCIKYIYKTESEFRLLFESKRINLDSKSIILKKALHNFNNLIIEFLLIILEKQSSKDLIVIIDKFLKLSQKHLNDKQVELITVDKLSDELINDLSTKLNCEIKSSIDESIIGGIKIRKGNQIFDNSISFQINHLKKTLYNL